jgi:GT2 family glycosyltransferase
VIDVVVPVYKGADETRRCLESVLASVQRVPFEVVVVDDASPEREIVAYLDELAARRRVTLLRNATNEGFVRSVNRGMALHADRDVVLLNSDVEVANDWLDRLAACASREPRIGTATPFSNNATICSYPFHGWSGGIPGTLGLAALDRLFASANAGRSVDLPTGVGSCLYLRRACLAEIGLFDAERFGRGYGEENDFCLRAANAGWHNVLCGDVFVYHRGAVSFAGERDERTQAATQALEAAHPDYRQRVREFEERDPAAPLREAVDAARVALARDEAARVLAERVEERAQLRARLAVAERVAHSYPEMVAGLRAGLARAEALVAQRDGAIARLSEGLAHAEKLAFERAAEIERLHGMRAPRWLRPFLRWGRRS